MNCLIMRMHDQLEHLVEHLASSLFELACCTMLRLVCFLCSLRKFLSELVSALSNGPANGWLMAYSHIALLFLVKGLWGRPMKFIGPSCEGVVLW